MKYFEVVAKCGHVGRMYYYEGHFFVSGDSKKAAAGKVKTFPRVKKDHEDVILWVEEVTEVQYKEGLAQMESNPYFQCGSKHEQNAIVELIQDQIFPETEIQQSYREKSNYYQDRQQKRRGKGIRNPYKYAKYNRVLEFDYIGA